MRIMASTLKLTASALKLTALSLAIAAIGLTSSGCKKETAGGEYGLSTKNNVVWWQLSDIQGLNPYLTSDESAGHVQALIWETLGSGDPRSLEPTPLLAALPELSADHLTYTFTMNPAAKWSDGKPVTSADVIFSFKALLNPKMLNNKALRGVFESLDSAYNPNGDVTKVAFHVNVPRFDGDRVLEGYTKILPKHVYDPKNLTDQMSWKELKNDATTDQNIADFGKFLESPEIGRDPKYIVGSGPYKFKGWVTNDRLIVSRDSAYWGQNTKYGDAYPDEIVFKTINDQNAALTALKAKDVDILEAVKPAQYLSEINLKEKPYLAKDSIYQNLYSYIGWNNQKPLFRDKRVRKALTMLIDRDKILHVILKDLGKKTEGPIVPQQPNCDPTVKQPNYDIEAAKKLLAEAGWKDSDGDGILDNVVDGKRIPFKFTFSVNQGNEIRKQMLLIVAEGLRKAGIEAEVSASEWSVYLKNMKEHNFEAFYGSWVGNVGEDDISSLWQSKNIKGGSNYYGYNNPEADKLMDAIRTEFDKTKRYEMWHQLQRMMTDDQPVTWLFAPPTLIAWVDRFDNFELFRTRPPFSPSSWIVRGSGVKRLPTGIVWGKPTQSDKSN